MPFGKIDRRRVLWHNNIRKRKRISFMRSMEKEKDFIAQKSMAKSIGMNTLSKLKESLFSVLPVAVIVLIFAVTPITDFTTKEIVTFVVSAIMLILGIALFNVGADLAMTPMGEQVGAGLTKSKKLPLLLGVGFAMGVLITVAEPDLSVLAEQVKAVMNSTVLIVTVGVGVGLFLVIAISKIVFRKDLSALLIFFYMVLFALTAIMFENDKGVFLPMAFDSGGVTTGPITVPFIMALGVGVASIRSDENAKADSFGLVGLCSIGPILSVMILGLVYQADGGTYTAVSIPVKEGEEAVEFPTAIAKKRNEETWKTGPDAEKSAHTENGIWLDNLYEICMGSRICQIENRDYTPGEVLGTFLREALKMIGIERPDQQIQAMMITTGHLTRPFVENVREAYKIIGLPRGRAYLQEHDESFYCHVLNQKPELWSRKVGLFFLKDEEASFSELSISRKTKPATVTVKRGPKAALSIEPMERDRDFCHLMGEAMGNEIYSSVFLVSEEFDLAWADNSLRQLKKNQRRIFGGTNLFAQGACFSAREKVEERRLKGYLFLGNDLVRYNIGMEMTINGSPSYYALIAAGVNWYEAEKECELILDGTEELEFVVSSMESGKRNRYTMKLDGLPKRPPKTTRIRLRLEYDSPVTCQITAEDLGFGDMFPASHKTWHETMGEV